jgi:hypothetical protein
VRTDFNFGGFAIYPVDGTYYLVENLSQLPTMAELPYYTTIVPTIFSTTLEIPQRFPTTRIFPKIFSTMRSFQEAASSFWNLPGFRV